MWDRTFAQQPMHMARCDTTAPVSISARFIRRKTQSKAGITSMFSSFTFPPSILMPTNQKRSWDVLTDDNAKNGMGVTHASEVASIWGYSIGIEATQIPIIQSYWASFIRTHDPNALKHKDAPNWGQYSINNGTQRLHFASNVTENAMELVGGNQTERCSYIASISTAIEQ
jgi:carboxylesterase type B